MSFGAAVAGFTLGFSLILAIGSQNAFVLRQGLRRSHVFAVCLTCAVSDALLITAGVGGFGQLSEVAPWFGAAMRYGGAAFLFVYGLISFRSSWRGSDGMSAEGQGAGSLRAALLTCLALTWLNPHVYLDTVVLLGSISAQYPGARLEFGLGAVVSSFVFFFSLGFGARLLAPIFARPRAWQVLDFGVGLTMWVIALGLIFGH
ncbi:LysE/ArgO family amino acid transporter [uncultured Litoreibacter sp.]|uniref:LysE/ArgO family amino acid transporter n=1 Tax=uncultured Litoreibacter sp. TaxID=1392394 RepID=UPI002612FB31|nr:LysE/ArgO family amino acid transporter [uncultured Litoreibacter sp.]